MTNNKLALIIDSSATYNKEFYEENNVFCIPLQLIDSNNKSYNDDNIDISQEEMLSQINKGLYFKTSLSNPGEMYNMVEDLCSKFENVVFFPVAYGISGQYNQVVNLIKPDFNNFHVVKNSSCAFATEAAIAKFIEITKTSSIEASISFIEQ
jgi:fatty acid-binding protein DegV